MRSEALQPVRTNNEPAVAALALEIILGGLNKDVVSSPIGELSIVPDIAIAETELIDANSIPELYETRQKAAENGRKVLSQNRHKLMHGEDAPRAVDALGTARQVVEVKRRYGEGSSEFKEIFTGLVLDSERLLAEAYSKNGAEYFAKVRQNFDRVTGSYFAHGLSISRMVLNGISPSAELEEQDRRLNENVEETGTYVPIGKMIGRVGLQGAIDVIKPSLQKETGTSGKSIDVTTISECVDYAIEDYKINPKGSHGGYAPSVEKLMIRRVHFAEDSGDRMEEQVAVPGIYITQALIRVVLAKKDAIAQDASPTKTELHGTQFVGIDSGGVMEFVAELDAAASEASGKNIFMGELVAAEFVKDYGDFVEQAEIRREKLAPKPTELANFLIALEENNTDGRLAEVRVDQFLKKTLLEVARTNPELAENMFDQETADGFREVARMRAEGDELGAQRLQKQVEEKAPEVSYCGGGGCGLEAVPNGSAMALNLQKLGLSGEELLHDTERACFDCNSMTVYYDGEGNKCCTSCRATEINGIITRVKDKQKKD